MRRKRFVAFLKPSVNPMHIYTPLVNHQPGLTSGRALLEANAYRTNRGRTNTKDNQSKPELVGNRSVK